MAIGYFLHFTADNGKEIFSEYLYHFTDGNMYIDPVPLTKLLHIIKTYKESNGYYPHFTMDSWNGSLSRNKHFTSCFERVKS